MLRYTSAIAIRYQNKTKKTAPELWDTLPKGSDQRIEKLPDA